MPGRNPAHPPLDLAAPPPAPPRRGRALLPGTGGARPGEGGGANAVRSAAADAAAPRPRTADEAAAQLGLEGDAVAGDVAAFRALDAAGKLTPEERAAMQAADAQALRAEGDAKAIAAALFCSIRGG